VTLKLFEANHAIAANSVQSEMVSPTSHSVALLVKIFTNGFFWFAINLLIFIFPERSKLKKSSPLYLHAWPMFRGVKHSTVPFSAEEQAIPGVLQKPSRHAQHCCYSRDTSVKLPQ
jgi:sugar phosphate permease